MIGCRGQIFAAMVLENVIPPIPSELTMPLSASVWASHGDHPVVILLQCRSHFRPGLAGDLGSKRSTSG